MSLSEPPEDPRTRANLNPAIAVRVGVVGSLVLALFAIVFFRLWFLQVLTGTHYVQAAAYNTTRQVAIAPRRGEVLSRSGRVLVSSTTELAAVIVPAQLPVKVNQTNFTHHYAADDAVYDRLAHLIHWSTRPRDCVIAGVRKPARLSRVACTVAQQIALNTYADVTVSTPVRRDLMYYVAERGNEFQGVQVQQVSVPGYPFGELAAQTLGTVGRLSTAQTSQAQFKGVNGNAIVGQSGLEAEYDRFLRGSYGHENVLVDAQGIQVGQGHTVQPTAGDDLKTTLDLKLEQVGDQSLARSIAANGAGLDGGAYVAMDPQTGAIDAMGSLPSFNPSVFTHPISQKQYDALSQGSEAPLFNRAIASEVPTGSTFKPITSVAALESGVWSPSETYTDPGYWCPPGTSVGSNQCRRNAAGAVGGTIDMESALKISDDVFYYHLGALLNDPQPQGGALQRWASRFGIGRNPHIDIPDAESGQVPTPAALTAQVKLEVQCEAAKGQFRYRGPGGYSATKLPGYTRTPKRPYATTGGCGIGIPGTVWTIGDNVNAAVGQGNDQVSPLQLAMVYSAIENGGTIVRPHVGQTIETPNGSPIEQLTFPAQRHLHINPAYLQTIQTGLHEAAQGGGSDPSPGTSQTVMQSFGLPVYGKTGTAQYIPTSGPRQGQETDYAWYACYVPASATHKPMVVVVWVEGGGYGAIASAPVARQLLSQWYYGKPGPYIAGNSQDQ